jgi:hypothetical protein
MPELEQAFQKRQTAYKIRINDFLNSEYMKTEGFKPNFIKINNLEISRFNIICVVLQKSALNNYDSFTVEDSSGKISARIFDDNDMASNIRIGDVVLIVGRPREFQGEKYIQIEIIKKVDPAWAKVRKLESFFEKASFDANIISPDEGLEELGPSSKIFKIIKDLDTGNGVSVEEISSCNIKDVDTIVEKLLREGNIFEVKPGKLKVLE